MEQYGQIELVYFGDSLTDDGNTFAVTGETLNTAYPPSIFGYMGKFSNGDTYAETTADVLSTDDYVNYAFGGAEAVGSQTLERYLTESGLIDDVKDESLLDYDINLSAQVERFLADHAGEDLSGVTASILIGANDYRNFSPSSLDPYVVFSEATALIQNVVTSTIATSITLLQSGVGTVLVNTLPPADFFPFLQSLPPELQALSRLAFAQHTQALVDAVESLSDGGANIRIVDLAAISTETLLDPSTFGFIAPLEDSVLVDMQGNSAAYGYDTDQVAFYDEVHPTEAGHGVWAMFQAENLTSEVTIGSQTNDDLAGSTTDDLILSSCGDDMITLLAGDDVAISGLGHDTVDGGQGSDILAGGSGDDNLSGGNGDDFIAGGNGTDLLNGGNGNDVLVDGLGGDCLFGGNGDDYFLFAEAELIGGQTNTEEIDLFNGGNGYDILRLALTQETRDLVQEALDTGAAMTGVLASIGIEVSGIEEFQFVDSRMDLSDIGEVANIADADLWGFV